MHGDSPESFQRLRALLVKILKDAEESDLPLVVVLVAEALAALPDEEQ